MKVTLAYPVEVDGKAHDVGDTVTVSDEIGRQLIHDGNGTPAESKSTTQKKEG